jgi:hypothetical protein
MRRKPMKYNEFNLSVRYFVEAVLKSGSLGNSFGSGDRMLEGIKLHQKLQQSRGTGYNAEVMLKASIDYKDFVINLEGRADGIFTEDGVYIIEEIKTIGDSLTEGPYETHRAQAICYAYIFAFKNNLETAGIQLTYYMTDSAETVYYKDIFSFLDLKAYFFSLLERYYRYLSSNEKK